MNERQLHIETLLKTLRFAPVDFDALFAECECQEKSEPPRWENIEPLTPEKS